MWRLFCTTSVKSLLVLLAQTLFEGATVSLSRQVLALRWRNVYLGRDNHLFDSFYWR